MTAALPAGVASAADAAALRARRAEIVAALDAVLPPHALLSQREDTIPYECDGLTAYRQQPLAVALPETEAQVAAVLRVCHRLGVPVVARGAGTGLSGGALPNALGVTLSLAKFNRIVGIDRNARTATVQCGVRNLAISEAAAPFGLFYAPDPSSQIACTIGGNVAENSGGVHCLKYGMTLHNVLKVRGFMADGEAVEFGSDSLDAAGLDLLSVLIGSEGMLAVVFEVTVKLLPKPTVARCLMASFADVRHAGDAVAAIIAAGIIPAGLEMMDKPMTAAVEGFVQAGYDLDAAAILLCESDGTAAEVEHEIARMADVLRASGATRLEASENEAQRLRFWSGRKNAFPASGRISPDYMCMDSTIPRRRLAEMLIAIGTMETKHRLRCVNVFHAGDGNLHPLILFDANDASELSRAEAFGTDILELSVAMGGTVTGEHGVGVEKLGAMCVQFTPAELTAMHAVKAAFDPAGLLNPGKAVPSLARCGEVGGARAKQTLAAFAELPRFLTVAGATHPATEALADRIRQAATEGRTLRIRGGGSKDFYGEEPAGDLLETSALTGPADHEPTELVVSAPAGLSLAALDAQLAGQGQALAFDPPHFGPGSTVGGMVAAGLSGPSRASAGALREHVLGLTMLDGRGELLRFGGRVIKNVAGYDVSRIVAGSLGVLGVIVEVSLKVLPRAEATTTLRFDLKPADALARLQSWGQRPLPLDASAWWNGNLVVRLRGSQAAVREGTAALGGETIEASLADAFWADLRDHRDPYFNAALDAIEHQDAALWRLSLPASAPHLSLAGDELIEWHGAQRWLVTSLPAATVRAAAASAGGHATIFRSRDKRAGVFTPLAPPLRAIHERLKQSFDPHGVFNPGRLYPGL